MSVSKRTRFLVLRRDNYACVYCGRRAPAVTLEIDHRIPRSAGGSDEIGNLVSACWDCNRGKGPINPDRHGRDRDYYLNREWHLWAEEAFESGPDSPPDELPRWFADNRGRRHHISKAFDWVALAESEIPARTDWIMTPVKVLALAEAFDTVEVLL